MNSTFVKAVALSLVFATVAGCAQKIGPEADDPELKGETVTEPLFTGGKQGPHVTLRADSLKSNESYRMANGNLTIVGNVPAGTSISVDGGKLHVQGDVGSRAELVARVPVDSHSESYSCLMYNAALKMSLPSTCWRTVEDGLTHPHDTTPAIRVDGKVKEGAELSSNAGVSAYCTSRGVKVETKWNRPVNIIRPSGC